MSRRMASVAVSQAIRDALELFGISLTTVRSIQRTFGFSDLPLITPSPSILLNERFASRCVCNSTLRNRRTGAIDTEGYVGKFVDQSGIPDINERWTS
jgi:hypothetical protein